MKYRKKPVVVEAHQLTKYSLMEICRWMNSKCEWQAVNDVIEMIIPTLEGNMLATNEDWIVKGESSKQGIHFWPVKPDYFEEHYEKVEMKLDDAVAKELKNPTQTHYETFQGQNCHELEGNNCSGWTVGEHRCDCGNRRICWDGEKDKNGEWVIWPVAY